MTTYCNGYNDNGEVINLNHAVKINGDWVETNATPKSGDSHGYCEECAKKQLEIMNKEAKKNAKAN